MSKKIPYHRKRLGQIFLRDALVVERILQSTSLAPDELLSAIVSKEQGIMRLLTEIADVLSKPIE